MTSAALDTPTLLLSSRNRAEARASLFTNRDSALSSRAQWVFPKTALFFRRQRKKNGSHAAPSSPFNVRRMCCNALIPRPLPSPSRSGPGDVAQHAQTGPAQAIPPRRRQA